MGTTAPTGIVRTLTGRLLAGLPHPRSPLTKPRADSRAELPAEEKAAASEWPGVVVTGMQPSVVFVVATLLTAEVFLREQLAALSERYRVTIVAGDGERCLVVGKGREIAVTSLPIRREISIWNDLVAVGRLWWLLRTVKAEVVHSITPKAGLLATVAGALAGTKHRVHTFTGQVWATERGFYRSLLKLCDRITAAAATNILVDSATQLAFLTAQRVVKPGKATVISNGSISGVDIQRFRPNSDARYAVRSRLSIPTDAILFLYVGRLKRAKGVVDLVSAFHQYCVAGHRGNLLLVGPDEEQLTDILKTLCGDHDCRVHFVGQVCNPEHYMAAADVLCLPSYREGFGTVLIEGAAVGIPCIATRIYGVLDAVIEGSTGLLCEPGDIKGLVRAMVRIAEDNHLRSRIGRSAAVRARERFSSVCVTEFITDYYSAMLAL